MKRNVSRRLSCSHLNPLPPGGKNLSRCIRTCRYCLFLIRQPPALPYRLQYSTIGRLSLNRRVRDVTEPKFHGCLP